MLPALLWQGHDLITRWWIATQFPALAVGDYVGFDNDARRIYVSHATQVEVLDADTGKFVGTIADTPGVHGAVVASAFKHGFTSNGREDKVSMFDPSTLKLIKKIDVGKGPDGIYYDQPPSASSPIITARTTSPPLMPKRARWSGQ